MPCRHYAYNCNFIKKFNKWCSVSLNSILLTWIFLFAAYAAGRRLSSADVMQPSYGFVSDVAPAPAIPLRYQQPPYPVVPPTPLITDVPCTASTSEPYPIPYGGASMKPAPICTVPYPTSNFPTPFYNMPPLPATGIPYTTTYVRNDPVHDISTLQPPTEPTAPPGPQ